MESTEFGRWSLEKEEKPAAEAGQHCFFSELLFAFTGLHRPKERKVARARLLLFGTPLRKRVGEGLNLRD